jgi:hypothetical protein
MQTKVKTGLQVDPGSGMQRGDPEGLNEAKASTSSSFNDEPPGM